VASFAGLSYYGWERGALTFRLSARWEMNSVSRPEGTPDGCRSSGLGGQPASERTLCAHPITPI
jgi:hypothetical protein